MSYRRCPVDDDVDIAIRGGYAPNERVQAVRLMDNHDFIPVAAASYLAAAGYTQTGNGA